MHILRLLICGAFELCQLPPFFFWPSTQPSAHILHFEAAARLDEPSRRGLLVLGGQGDLPCSTQLRIRSGAFLRCRYVGSYHTVAQDDGSAAVVRKFANLDFMREFKLDVVCQKVQHAVQVLRRCWEHLEHMLGHDRDRCSLVVRSHERLVNVLVAPFSLTQRSIDGIAPTQHSLQLDNCPRCQVA